AGRTSAGTPSWVRSGVLGFIPGMPLQPLCEPEARMARRHSLQLAKRLVAQARVELGRLEGESAQEADFPASLSRLRFRRLHESGSDSLTAYRLVDPEQLDEQPVPEAQADQSADELARLGSRGQDNADIVEGARALLVESEEAVADLVRELVELLRLERDLRVQGTAPGQ